MYGSLTTAIVVLLSLEIAALVLLLGAQVIAEYERSGSGREPGRAEGVADRLVLPERTRLIDRRNVPA